MTEGQLRRLNELGVFVDPLIEYNSAEDRDQAYRGLEQSQLKVNRRMLKIFRTSSKQSSLLRLQEKLGASLRRRGFIQVSTPTIISKNSLEKMGVDEEHKLTEQVFWLDDNKCLRPMLAPNLYEVSKNLLNIYDKPLGIFEIGSCFRKESQGSIHLNEFTMLNLVEWGTPIEHRQKRIKELAGWILEEVDIEDYSFEVDESVVYGSTIDVIYKGTELASCSMGPHLLDDAWGINESWVGIGFGLERLLMLRDECLSIHSIGKSLSYLDGVRLNIK